VRARRLLALGEALAAEEDLARVRAACGVPRDARARREDRALARAIDAGADAQVRDRVAQNRCVGADCTGRSGERRAAERTTLLAAAREQGPAATRRASARLGASLPAEETIDLLLADLRGELGEAVLLDDEIRTWVGGAGWESLSSLVVSRHPAEAAYLQLRLAGIVADMPIAPAPSRGPTQLDRWADRAFETERDHGWRVSAWEGDLAGAEFAITTAWRPTDGGEPPPPVEGVAVPEHWIARVSATPQWLRAALVLARLRAAGGHEDEGLAIARFAIARAHALELAGALAQARTAVVRVLADGRPWHALALADAWAGAGLEDLVAAASTGVLLEDAVCGGACADDADRDSVARVLGEAWMKATAAAARERALAHRGRIAAVDDCPTLAELLAPDAASETAEALALARDRPRAPELPTRLARALEADPAIACAGRTIAPLLAARSAGVEAARIADLWSHAAQMRASAQLFVHAQLAIIADRPRQSELLAIASAASARVPAGTWRRLAAFALATGRRDIGLMALREALLHRPDLDDSALRLRIAIEAVLDRVRGPAVAGTPAGRESAAREVEAWVGEGTPLQTWSRREQLARTIAREHELSPGARKAVIDTIFPTDELRSRHRGAVAAVSGMPPREDPRPFDLAALELAITTGRAGALPAVTAFFADPRALVDVRLAIARHARDWSAKRRAAIGVASFGSAADRLRAAAALVRAAPEERRRAIVDVLVQVPAALAPSDGPEIARAVGLADDDEALLRVAFSLPFEPGLMIDEAEDAG
jgi:hypothetical protein